jgi:hypothetical protein
MMHRPVSRIGLLIEPGGQLGKVFQGCDRDYDTSVGLETLTAVLHDVQEMTAAAADKDAIGIG